MSELAQQVMAALATVQEPELGNDLVSLSMIEDLKVEGQHASFKVVLTTPACPLKSLIEANCRSALRSQVPDLKDISISFTSKVRTPIKRSLPIAHVLAVSSGKGGVGKSTVSVNLALALAASGARVGILDADVYGPNIPLMLGLLQLPPMEGELLLPGEAFGLQVMSIGYMVDADQALMWRGPMLHGAIQKMLHGTKWPELDYLIIDLPPGTGDAQMSVAQSTVLSAGVVVTTPQKVAVADARRGISAFHLLKVPVLGVIENMAGGIFGSGGGETAAAELKLPFLGRIPLDPELPPAGDNARPLIKYQPHHPLVATFNQLAGRIAAALSVIAHRQESASAQ